MSKSKHFLTAACCIALSFPLMVKSDPAQAECHFKTAAAIACYEPHNAATAYKNYGFKASLINESYTRAILARYNCFPVGPENHDKSGLKLVANYKVALPAGWVPISDVEINNGDNHDMVYVATAYINGTCEKRTGPRVTVPPFPGPVTPPAPVVTAPFVEPAPAAPASNGAAAL